MNRNREIRRINNKAIEIKTEYSDKKKETADFSSSDISSIEINEKVNNSDLNNDILSLDKADCHDKQDDRLLNVEGNKSSLQQIEIASEEKVIENFSSDADNSIDICNNEQRIYESVSDHKIENIENHTIQSNAILSAEKGTYSVSISEVAGHENEKDAHDSNEKEIKEYEMNPYKMTEADRADIREGIMNGDIGENEIRKIGEPLRKRYNDLSVEALNRLDNNEIKRKELIRQEIYSKSREELMEIKDQLQALRRDDTEVMLSYTPMKNMEKVLGEARAIGLKDNDTGQFYINESDVSVKHVISVIDDIRTRLPADWVEKSNDEPILAQHTLRGYFIKTDGISTIALSSHRGMERAGYHELGHYFEELYPEIRKIEHEFYNRRTEGEYSRWLGPPYPLKEKYRPDNFTNGYMGKDYGNREDSGFEIFSMGIEGLYTGNHKLHRDKEYQDLVFGILAAV